MKKILLYLCMIFYFHHTALAQDSISLFFNHRVNEEGYLELSWTVKNNSIYTLMIPSSFKYKGVDQEGSLQKENFYWVETNAHWKTQNVGEENKIIIRLGQRKFTQHPRQQEKITQMFNIELEQEELLPQNKKSGNIRIAPVLYLNNWRGTIRNRSKEINPRNEQLKYFFKNRKVLLCNIEFRLDYYIKETNSFESIKQQLQWCADGLSYASQLLPQNNPVDGANFSQPYYPPIIWRNNTVRKKWQGEIFAD